MSFLLYLQGERRPRLQKDLITIMESAFKQSTDGLKTNTLILMSSLPPPPYAKTPPPYRDHERHRGCPETSRVVVECSRDNPCHCLTKTDDESVKYSRRTDVTFLKEHHNCHCDGLIHKARVDTKLRHGTVVWDDSDPETEELSAICTDAVIYRNPMIRDTNSAHREME